MVIFIFKKKLFDYRIDLKFVGLDCSFNIVFLDLKIVFEMFLKFEIMIFFVVIGFDVFNKFYFFKVFKDKVEMYVLIIEEMGMVIKFKIILIWDELIFCKEEVQEEYVCDFIWFCNKDLFVRLKFFFFVYIRDGFFIIIDVQGLDKFCILFMFFFF